MTWWRWFGRAASSSHGAASSLSGCALSTKTTSRALSLIHVDPKKQLWNCLGACNEGGDVYRFVMKADGVDFREAHQRLGGGETEAKPVRADDLQWLERAVEHYHKRLLETPAAQEYLQSRGITAPEIIAAFRLGYSDGTLEEKLPPEGKAALRRIGLLTGSGSSDWNPNACR